MIYVVALLSQSILIYSLCGSKKCIQSTSHLRVRKHGFLMLATGVGRSSDKHSSVRDDLGDVFKCVVFTVNCGVLLQGYFIVSVGMDSSNCFFGLVHGTRFFGIFFFDSYAQDNVVFFGVDI